MAISGKNARNLVTEAAIKDIEQGVMQSIYNVRREDDSDNECDLSFELNEEAELMKDSKQ